MASCEAAGRRPMRNGRRLAREFLPFAVSEAGMPYTRCAHTFRAVSYPDNVIVEPGEGDHTIELHGYKTFGFKSNLIMCSGCSRSQETLFGSTRSRSSCFR